MHPLWKMYMISGAEFSCPGIDSFEVITLNIRSTIRSSVVAGCLVILILDSRTAMAGAAAGIDICIRTLIPSLFPFFVLSILLTGALIGQPIRFLRPVAKLCRIPAGCESLLAIGFLGGYPVGAQNIAFAWEQGSLSSEDAQRMVAFCNNAGPAFIFGFLGQIFQNPLLPWLLWMTHMTSAIAVGFLLPGGIYSNSPLPRARNLTLSGAVDKSVRVMAQVCSWVILFRMILEFLRGWFLDFIPPAIQIMLTGFLELANGCLLLQKLPSDGLKFILSAVMLGFGGVCVYLQTQSISGSISLRLYIPGKLLQGCLSFLLSYPIQFFFQSGDRIRISSFFVGAMLIATILTSVILRNFEKSVAISGNILYNEKSCEKRRTPCCSGRKSKDPVPTAFTAPN